MKKLFSLSIICIALVIFYSSAIAQMTGRDIMLKVEKQQDTKTRIVKSKMILINKQNKTRERDVVQYVKSVNDPKGVDDKILIFFEYPADIRGTGLLMISYSDVNKDDDRWLYLPALKKVRRIAGESKNEYFMGTDFTYDDMGGRSVDQDKHT
ncbi:MAG: outer membrane lipoprotein-sorting protein, partial [Candidatus Marinimicrobia bacterium]|nr:outer membrane lipoprotein-sorting protein [Candidatus Neomarinimicrobiota bacterium]